MPYFVTIMALQPFDGHWPLFFQFLDPIHNQYGSLSGDQPVARPLPTHRTKQTQNKRTKYTHPCVEWDSNPRSQRSSERRQLMS
jgi:hypothetical protein